MKALVGLLVLLVIQVTARAETIYVTWPTVAISGTRELFGSDSYGMLAFSIVRANTYGPYGSGPRLDAADLADLKAEALEVIADKRTSPDIRCNLAKAAMGALNQVTSRHDAPHRRMAAESIAQIIRAVDSGKSIRAMSRGGGVMGMDSRLRLSFTVTYADGGKETWPIDSMISAPMLQDAGNTGLTQGDGKPCPCPN